MITKLLVALNVLAFLWEVRVGGSGVFSGRIPDQSAIINGTLIPVAVTHYHQWYRIFTGAFLHASILHIGVNMFSLFILGRFVESIARSFRMLLIYVFSIIVSGLGVVYLAPPDAVTLGASGAIFGLFGALFAIGLKFGERGRQLIRANLGILALNLVFSFAAPGISWQAHVAGLVGGFIFTYLIYYPPRPVYTPVYDANTGAEYESHLEEPNERH